MEEESNVESITTEQSKRKATRKQKQSKAEGGKYERKVAKQLSEWMFDNPVLLRRSSDSGAQKCNYTGDIIPEGQLPIEWNNRFPFHIECKHGYKKHEPDFWKHSQLDAWVRKEYHECQQHNQYITLLVTQFPHRLPIVTTNYQMPLVYTVCFPVEITPSFFVNYFVYHFNDLLKLNFYEVFSIKDLCHG